MLAATAWEHRCGITASLRHAVTTSTADMRRPPAGTGIPIEGLTNEEEHLPDGFPKP